MSFISDVKLLANLFKAKQNLVETVSELESECTTLKQDVSKLRSSLNYSKCECEDLISQEKSLKEKVSSLNKAIDVHQKKIFEIHQLESVEFIRTLIDEKGYEIEKLDLHSAGLTFSRLFGSSRYIYQKNKILECINFSIQEFAAKEGLSYEKLKESLYNINAAWFESFNYEKNDYFERDNSTINLLTKSFMMIKKKKSKKIISNVHEEG